MTPFATIIQGCGLSQREAAAFLAVSPRTVEAYVQGKRDPGPGHMTELLTLAQRQMTAAWGIVAAYWEAAAAAGEPSQRVQMADLADYAARAIDWPCAGAYRAVIRRAWECLPAGTMIELVNPSEPTVTAARRARQFTD